MTQTDGEVQREAFEAMRLFVERFWIRNGREPVDVAELLDWTDTGLWDDPAVTNDPAQWADWVQAVADVRAGARASGGRPR
jgi:hypothetical protein